MKKKLIFLEFHSIYLIRELFTFIPKNKQFKLNKYNSYLIKILQLKSKFFSIGSIKFSVYIDIRGKLVAWKYFFSKFSFVSDNL